MADRTMVVKRYEVMAAQMKLSIDDQLGREHSPAVVAIANAKPRVREVSPEHFEVEYVMTIPQCPGGEVEDS